MTSPRSFLDDFADVVQRQGDHVAVMVQGQPALTYRELDRRARCVGGTLRSLGAKQEPLVGLGIERSADYLVGLLGTWFAGAAFVPLDPTLPRQRLARMLRDANVEIVLVAEEQASLFTELGVRPLTLSEACGSVPIAKPTVLNPDDLAYVFFTSGSTGLPKGVLVPQRGLLACLRTQIDVFRLTSACHSLFVLSTNFDASISDIGTTLLAGATLHLERDELLPSAEFASLLRKRGITHVDLPPAYLSLLDPEQMPTCLQTIVIGGEVCPPEVVRRWASRVRLVNVYGPTEATICTSLGVCDATWESPLIGQPIPGIRYEVVDEWLDQVGVGTPGELLIFGDGLARGYLGRYRLMLKKFPFVRGQRAYRTGDRVVHRYDAEYEFLGRVDRQFKLQGKLIAPEEIEAILLEHSHVAEVAVVAKKSDTSVSLVAYVVAKKQQLTVEVLREHLREGLPSWMIPHRFEFVDRLPRTATGKIDYVAVARPRSQDPLDGQNDGQNERSILLEIARRVLVREAITLDDRFFDVGGDSLRALQVVAEAEAHGLPISVSQFTSNVTLRELIEQPASTISCEILHEEANLGADWRDLLELARTRPALAQGSHTNAFLLTGATGFLGAHLLAELLRTTSATAVCLIRANDEHHARHRLANAVPHLDLSRVRVVCGDLAEPYFGLDASTWTSLATEVDAVYHCAANVNMVASYETLRPTNVLGTREVLRLLCTGKRKRLHYASTLSVFVASDHNIGLLRENDALQSMQEMHGGYGQSKWAAEYLLRAHESAIAPVSYYRLGLLTGDSHTGVSGSTDHLGMVCRGLAKLGCVPDLDLSQCHVDVTPIDYAASAIGYLSLQVPARTFHLANPTSLSLEDLVQSMRDFGIPLEHVALDTWRERVRQYQRTENDPLVALAFLGSSRCLDSAGQTRHRTVDLFQATDVVFETVGTRSALAGSGIVCPPPSPELLARYLRHWFSD